ncbi:MAG TPA: hypothetical protein EYP24_02870, partial [bacterium (Candidatus Stahlbacteria)]|nr:hypothetical protein [Candidatus Stahlbacteria bacterium]
MSNTLTGVEYQDTLVNGITYRRFRLEGSYLPEKKALIGRPELPAVRVLVAVPDSAEITLRAQGLFTLSYDNIAVYPRPEIRYDTADGGVIYWFEVFKKDETFYQQDQVVPNRLARVVSDGHFRDQRVLEVLIFPIRCNPAKNEVYIHTKVLIGIRFKGECYYDTLGLGPFENLAHDLFLNYKELRRRYPIPEGPPPPPPGVHYYTFLKNPDNRADYLIVAHDTFFLSQYPTWVWIDRLAHWRCDHNRYDIGIVKMSDIYEEFPSP